MVCWASGGNCATLTTGIPGGPAREGVVGVLVALGGRDVAVAAFGAWLVAVGLAWLLLLATVTGVAVAFGVTIVFADAMACCTAVASSIVALIARGAAGGGVADAAGEFPLDPPPKQLWSKKARPMISHNPALICDRLLRDELV